MKMNFQGVDIELTPKEFFEMQELSKKEPKNMTFEEEMKLLETLRHFEVLEISMIGIDKVKVVLVSDVG